MLTLFSSNYLARRPVEKAVAAFGQRFHQDQTVLDIGCGDKPYAHYFTCKYIGLDPFPTAKADIVRNAWDSGLPDNSVDGVVLNQSLEHISNTVDTIKEIERVLKPGGLVLVTVPQTVRNHTTPIPSTQVVYKNFDTQTIPYWNEDFWRFTKFGLIHLFRNFHIEKLEESNTYLGTMAQLSNYFFASFGLGTLFSPIYFLNNICGAILDWAFLSFGKLPFPAIKKFDQLITRGLTLNIILIAKKL